MERLRQRADFLAVAAGARVPSGGFVLQARQRRPDGVARIGFTVTKRTGNAVERNRVRRRLREMVRLTPSDRVRPGHDYVLVGRRAALTLPFDRLMEDFDRALRRAHAGGKPASGKSASDRSGAGKAADGAPAGSPSPTGTIAPDGSTHQSTGARSRRSGRRSPAQTFPKTKS